MKPFFLLLGRKNIGPLFLHLPQFLSGHVAKCFKQAEKPTETVATQASYYVTFKYNLTFYHISDQQFGCASLIACRLLYFFLQ